MKSLATFLNHNFKNNDFRLYDKNHNEVYFEDSTGYWYKKEYDTNNNETYYEDSEGYWERKEYNKNNEQIKFISSN